MQASKNSALITGGGGGVERNLLATARDGYHVYVHASTALDKAQAVVESIQPRRFCPSTGFLM